MYKIFIIKDETRVYILIIGIIIFFFNLVILLGGEVMTDRFEELFPVLVVY